MRVRNLLTGHWCEPIFSEETQSWGAPDNTDTVPFDSGDGDYSD